MVYQWSGFSYKVSAQKVGEELEKLEDEHGSLSKEMIVDAARPEASVMHKLFEWNDSIAGEKWRQQQAKTMLSCLHIVVEQSTPDKEFERFTVRAYVNSETDDSRTKGAYISVTDALQQNAPTRETIISNARRELSEFKKKYSTYTEFADVIAAIERLEDEDGVTV